MIDSLLTVIAWRFWALNSVIDLHLLYNSFKSNLSVFSDRSMQLLC